ncbi:MAG TPA: glycoside hydrolase 43 family protein [Verrucomicrobiae bacterium]|jgi:beta-xylosidase|nr:glycoside hydrolase 43 family protein [Verrucomicrobiae bacterium]
MQTLAPTQIPATSADSAPFPWHPDCGDGTYRNPVIYADYSDPDVIRVGNDFYLTASSFNCTPGLPILHSKDLVNWRIIGHALENLPHPRYARVQPGCGVWAPAMRFHAGKFWIFFPMPDEGIYVVTAGDPAGKWSKPHLLQSGKGLIDPCPLWDDDGNAYLVHAYAHSRARMKHILRVRPMAPDGSKLLGPGQIVFHEPERQPTLEGPKFLKRDGWYYILAPAGGVTSGWQVVLRSRNIYGPYEDKIVLSQGSTPINGPHQGALLDTPNGDWWFIHFQDAGVYGRVSHLQPVVWRDQWPLMGSQNGNGIGEPVLQCAKPIENGSSFVPQTSDEFNSSHLGLQWQWHANHKKSWYSLGRRKGWLRLYPQYSFRGQLSDLPNLLLQKFPARSFTVETFLNFAPKQSGEEAGIIVAGKSCASFAIEKSGSRNRLVLRINGVEKFVQENVPSLIKLRASVENGGLSCFSFADLNGFISVPELFQAENGVWIGAKIGLYSLTRKRTGPNGYVDVDYFRFSTFQC